ncbi:MAG: DUF998 domain-containing protein [Halobacteriota archaeon]
MKPRLPGGFMLSSALLAPVVGVVGVSVAAFLAPGFEPLEHGLSHLGVAEGPAALVFAASVVLTGVAAFPFGLVLAFAARNAVEKLGVAMIWVGVFSMWLLGFVSLDMYEAHLALGLSFFGLVTAAFYVYGAGNAFAGDVRHGVVTMAFGGVHQAGWLVWGVTWFRGYDDALLEAPGLLLPEAFGLALLVVWAVREAYGPVRDEWRGVLDGSRMRERRGVSDETGSKRGLS